MGKKFLSKKILIISVAIFIAVLSLSVGIFGLIKSNKKDKNSQGETGVWYHVLKKDTFYEISSGYYGIGYKIKMSSKNEMEFYVNNVKSLSLMLVGSNYYSFESKKDISDENNYDHFAINDTFLDKCIVYNNDGLTLFNKFKYGNGYSYGPVINYTYTVGGSDVYNQGYIYWNPGNVVYGRRITDVVIFDFYLEKNCPINIKIDDEDYTKELTDEGLKYTNKSGSLVLQSVGENVDISTPESLKVLAYEWSEIECATNAELRAVKNIKITKDLDMSEVKNMKPIADYYGLLERYFIGDQLKSNKVNLYFRGTFDGGGHTISNLTTSLIGHAYGTIKNLYIKNSTANNALLVAWAGGATIKNIFVEGECTVNYKPTSTTGSYFYKEYDRYTIVEREKVRQAIKGAGSLVGVSCGQIEFFNCGLYNVTINCTEFAVRDPYDQSHSDAYWYDTIRNYTDELAEWFISLGGLLGLNADGAEFHSCYFVGKFNVAARINSGSSDYNFSYVGGLAGTGRQGQGETIKPIARTSAYNCYIEIDSDNFEITNNSVSGYSENPYAFRYLFGIISPGLSSFSNNVYFIDKDAIYRDIAGYGTTKSLEDAFTIQDGIMNMKINLKGDE